ncbi:hypothetical protein HDV00_001474 [Rhizophlyctis rosea]|nr:hypothetical protein HDV00_001474 [Rhizophlyctis rosea]
MSHHALLSFGFNGHNQSHVPKSQSDGKQVGIAAPTASILLRTTHPNQILGVSATWATSFAWTTENRIYLWGWIAPYRYALQDESYRQKRREGETGGAEDEDHSEKEVGEGYIQLSSDILGDGGRIIQVIAYSPPLESTPPSTPPASYPIYILTSTGLWTLTPSPLPSNSTPGPTSGNTLKRKRDSSKLPKPTPTYTPIIRSTTLKSISLTKSHILILTQSETLHSLPLPRTSQTTLPDPPSITPIFTHISTSPSHALLLVESGAVHSYADGPVGGLYGQLGHGVMGDDGDAGEVGRNDHSSSSSTPRIKIIEALHGLTGSNTHHQLGTSQSTTKNTALPTPIDLPPDVDITPYTSHSPPRIFMSSGSHHTLLATPAELFAWGWNKWGQCGSGGEDGEGEFVKGSRRVDLPVLGEGQKIVGVFAGWWHSLVVVEYD